MGSCVVSIHAPAKGATRGPSRKSTPYRSFNPRTREGCDCAARASPSTESCFNPRTRERCDCSTSATRPSGSCFNPRTREGCDSPAGHAPRSFHLFQSTHPRRVRRHDLRASAAVVLVSIHAPAKGATMVVADVIVPPVVSIHAPAKGATAGRRGAGRGLRRFNPRTREGCDSLALESHADLRVSIHAPAKGAT